MTNTTKQEHLRTTLIIPKARFKIQLTEQISKVSQLGINDINTEDQLVAAKKKYDQWDAYNNELLKSAFNNPLNEHKQAYFNCGQMIGVYDLLKGVINLQSEIRDLIAKIEIKTNALEKILAVVEIIHSNIEINRTDMGGQETERTSKDTVFIIHGHDEAMKKDVQLFLKNANLNDIVLHEQPDKNRTVIEKLIEEGNSAAYVIALLSPDDIQKDNTVRARQNVILEIGYFIGRLGREKVRLLKKGDVEIPSDLQGILYENYDDAGGWQLRLMKEMLAANIPLDTISAIKKS